MRGGLTRWNYFNTIQHREIAARQKDSREEERNAMESHVC